MGHASHFRKIVLCVAIAALLVALGVLELRLFPAGAPPRADWLFTPSELLAVEAPPGIVLEVTARPEGSLVYLDVTVRNVDDAPLLLPMPLADTVDGYARDGLLVLPSLTRTTGHPKPGRRPPCFPLARPDIYVGPGQAYRETLTLAGAVRAELDMVPGDRVSGVVVVVEAAPFDDASILGVEQGSLVQRRPGRALHRLAMQVELPHAIETSTSGAPIRRAILEMPPCPPLVTPNWTGGLESCSTYPPWGPSSPELARPPPEPQWALDLETVATLEARVTYFGVRAMDDVLWRSGMSVSFYIAEREHVMELIADEQAVWDGPPPGILSFRYSEARKAEATRLAGTHATVDGLSRLPYRQGG